MFRIIKNAVMKMDSSIINKEGIEKLLTMLPSEEEVSKIEEAQEVNPELPLGTAEEQRQLLGPRLVAALPRPHRPHGAMNLVEALKTQLGGGTGGRGRRRQDGQVPPRAPVLGVVLYIAGGVASAARMLPGPQRQGRHVYLLPLPT